METEREKEKNPHLHAMMDVLGEMFALLPEDPPPDDCLAPHWPQAEMTAVFRTVAGQAGLPKRCSRRRCARTGRCHGAPDTDFGTGCTALWTDAEFDKCEIAALALVMAWGREIKRLGRLIEGPEGGLAADAAAADLAAADIAGDRFAAGEGARGAAPRVRDAAGR